MHFGQVESDRIRTLWRSAVATGDRIEDEAIVGDGHYLAFTPCCRQPVLLTKAEVKPVNAVRCPKNSRAWDLEFVKRGVEWKAIWTP